VVSAPDGAKCGCLEEVETCNSNGCDATTTTATTTEGQSGTSSLEFQVCGQVKNVEDDSDIAGATVKILDKTAETDATGGFCIEKVPEGTVKPRATKDGWLDVTRQGTRQKKITKDRDDVLLYMSKTLSPKDWRIVLTWGKTPLDLDARTQFAKAAGCNVSYDIRSATCAQNGIEGKLDQDHCFYAEDGKHSCNKKASLPGGPSHESKPETTTLTNVDPAQGGKITFHVSNYMVCLAWNNCPAGAPSEDTGTLAASQAEVKVIHGDKEVAFYQLAKQEGNIRYQNYDAQYHEWWVFYIDVKESKVVTCTSTNCY